MSVADGAGVGGRGVLERVVQSVAACAGVMAMAVAFILDLKGFSRPVSGIMLFSGVVLFSAGVGAALASLRQVGSNSTPRDARQSEWYGRMAAMPVAALAVALFVGPDLWALITEGDRSGAVFVLVAVALIVGNFAELVLFRLRPLLDDELTRTYATGAMAWGFVAGFIGFAVVLGLMVVDLKVGVLAILPVMALTVWAAGLRLFWLMRETD